MIIGFIISAVVFAVGFVPYGASGPKEERNWRQWLCYSGGFLMIASGFLAMTYFGVIAPLIAPA